MRLERIEESFRGLHDKVDELIEGGAVNRTHLLWLKWAVRLLFAGVAGLAGLAWPGLH